jgi:hypothetical protein
VRRWVYLDSVCVVTYDGTGMAGILLLCLTPLHLRAHLGCVCIVHDDVGDAIQECSRCAYRIGVVDGCVRGVPLLLCLLNFILLSFC